MEYVNKLSMGERLIVGGAVLMLIASFLPWYSIEIPGLSELGIGDDSFSVNGWKAPGAIWSILAVLISAAMAGVILATKFGNAKLPALGQYSWAQALLAAGALVVICIVLKLIGESSYMAFGFFLGIIAAVLVAAGAYLQYTEERGGGVVRT